jgi:hypothetical protein
MPAPAGGSSTRRQIPLHERDSRTGWARARADLPRRETPTCDAQAPIFGTLVSRVSHLAYQSVGR